MKISDILSTKGADVVITPVDATVREILVILAENDIGALVVVDGGDQHNPVLGIVSERDIVRRLNEWGDTLLDSEVGQIMTTDIVSCSPDDDVDRIAAVMTERRVRHMPVLDSGSLIGLVSIGDVVKSRIEQLEVDRGQLEHYITG